MPTGESPHDVYEALKACRLEEALVALRRKPGRFPLPGIGLLVEDLERRARELRMAGEVGAWRRVTRHVFALSALVKHGPQPGRMIRDVELAPDYDGKILLMKLAGGLLDGKLCLRGGDEWHREILRNTVAEIRDLGFTGMQVHSLGGAFLRFEGRRRLRLWGTSDEFGRCDMALAVQLLRRAFPATDMRVDD